MSVGKLATALSIIFAVSVLALAGELLYVLWRHRSFRRRSSTTPHTHNNHENPNFSITDAATKELLYFFCMKPHQEHDPPEAPNKDKDHDSSSDDQEVDVFKMLDAKGPARFLCTIKEEDKEEVESKPDVDLSNNQINTESVCLTVDRDDGNTKIVFSTPCDSPVFFTPVGSPSREFMESEFVYETGDVII